MASVVLIPQRYAGYPQVNNADNNTVMFSSQDDDHFDNSRSDRSKQRSRERQAERTWKRQIRSGY
jgi:hypothetical protein